MGNKIGAFIAGGLAGAAVALLCAPRSGRETRTMVADKVNDVWGEAQNLGGEGGVDVRQAYQNAAARGQEVVQNVAAKGQEFAQAAQAKGQEVYGQASERVQGVVSGIGAQAQDNDELRDKIEAARQRIAAQVAKNAGEAQAAADAAIPVAADAADAAAGAAEGAPEAAENTAAKADGE